MERCDKCGFLATKTLAEVGQGSRTAGNIEGSIPIFNPSSGRDVDGPICFMQAEDLQAELNKISNTSAEAIVLSLITKERDCSSFKQWIMGFSPKEHREMIDREKMLKGQTEREEADKQWREKQEKNADRRHKENLLIMGGLVTVVYVITQIISIFILKGLR